MRKRGTAMLMLPGGKPEPSETYAEAVIREFHEELGGRLNAAQLTALGIYTASAANETGYEVEGHIFTHPAVPFDGPHAEIEYIEWVHPACTDDTIAPMSRQVLAEL